MKKILLVVIVVVLSLLLVSCGPFLHKYRLLSSESEISEISIVTAYFDDNNEFMQSEIITINDIDEFMKDFRKVSATYVILGDPRGLFPTDEEGTIIRITYNNGEYELINWYGQSRYTIESGFRYYNGDWFFDEEQFNNLIDKYNRSI